MSQVTDWPKDTWPVFDYRQE